MNTLSVEVFRPVVRSGDPCKRRRNDLIHIPIRQWVRDGGKGWRIARVDYWISFVSFVSWLHHVYSLVLCRPLMILLGVWLIVWVLASIGVNSSELICHGMFMQINVKILGIRWQNFLIVFQFLLSFWLIMGLWYWAKKSLIVIIFISECFASMPPLWEITRKVDKHSCGALDTPNQKDFSTRLNYKADLQNF